MYKKIPYVPILMRPGIGRNASCALGDCLTSRPKGHSQPSELWFSIYSYVQLYYVHACIYKYPVGEHVSVVMCVYVQVYVCTC